MPELEHPNPPETKKKERIASHVDTMAIRLTREYSDKNRIELIPQLVDVLIDGKFSLKHLMQLSATYFSDPKTVGLVSTYGGKTFLGENEEGVDVLKQNVENMFNLQLPKNEQGLRSIDVRSGEDFDHPDPRLLYSLALPLVERINELVDICPQMSDMQIHTCVLRIHLILSTLHLPSDGSGRFIGDADTLIQEAIKKKLAQSGRKYAPQYYSVTGYRIAGNEKLSEEAEDKFRLKLIQALVRKISKRKREEGKPEPVDLERAWPFTEDFLARHQDQLERVHKQLGLNPQASKMYEEEMYRYMDTLIKSLLYEGWGDQALEGISEIKSLLPELIEKRWPKKAFSLFKRKKVYGEEYFASSSYKEYADLFDVLVGLLKRKNIILLKKVLEVVPKECYTNQALSPILEICNSTVYDFFHKKSRP